MKHRNGWIVALVFGGLRTAMAARPAEFRQAEPVWLAGTEREMNVLAGFRAVIVSPSADGATLRATGSTFYRVTVNGEFVGHGPARAGHGWFRVDEWPLDACLRPGTNVVAIEVAGYNINSFAYLDQPSFLQAEIVAGDRVLAATGAEDATRTFTAMRLDARLQRVPRYSYQRGFMEVWRLTPGWDLWRRDPAAPWSPAPLARQPGGRSLPRGVPLPECGVVRPAPIVIAGTLVRRPVSRPWKDRSLTIIGPNFKGFAEPELETCPPVEYQHYADGGSTTVTHAAGSARLSAMEYRVLDFRTNLTGFIGVRLRCQASSRVMLSFDELLPERGPVNWRRLSCASLVDLRLEPGEYTFETIEPYTLRALQLAALEGAEVELLDAWLREFATSGTELARVRASDPAVEQVFEAGRQTFRQNAVDIFMDCPSRERAGWLCDSFFTARTAMDLQGNARIERAFLENFALPDAFPRLPEGMLPMCYPSDHYNGEFIPNWAMWFVLQLREYLQRTGDRELVERLRPRVLRLVEYFQRLRNADGLLEKLPSWVFVEWSMANKFVQDVNYPSNMLYAEMLDAIAELYGQPQLAREAAGVREAIRRQSWDGEFFVDNAVRRPDGTLEVTRNRTETCQYYAFYFRVATPATHPQLWDRLVRDFGPQRKGTGRWPEIHPSNQLIGNVMRFELLSREGLTRRLFEEAVPYHRRMAELTGTLWEFDGPQASCNHGFASHGGVRLLYRDVLGLWNVSHTHREVILRIPDVPLEWCEGTMPTPDGPIELRWHRAGEGVRIERLVLPKGWRHRLDDRAGGVVRVVEAPSHASGI
ncbi:MAG: hypothetical protein N2652_12050 [Kiritimatiellae bacterium]|nr:hypothetical protein [Kiritimatiellia bacterium]